MTSPNFDPCSPIPLGEDFLAGRPSVHRTTAASHVKHGAGSGAHVARPPVPHVHHPVYRPPNVIPPNVGCGAAKWIAGGGAGQGSGGIAAGIAGVGLGAAGIGGGVVAGGEIIRAAASPLPSHGGWFPGGGGDGQGSGGVAVGIAIVGGGSPRNDFAGAPGGTVNGSPPFITRPDSPVDVPEPSALLLFVLACLIAMLIRHFDLKRPSRIRKVRQSA